MGGFHHPSGALEYWGDVERLPALVKSMHLKKPMQVKLGKSDKAKTHLVKKDEVVKYHLAWVSYNAKSGKYQNATYSPGHLKLHTQLQRDPSWFSSPPSPKEAGGLLSCSKGLPMATWRRLRALWQRGPSSSFVGIRSWRMASGSG